MADGDNYSGFTARADPPAGGLQRVSVSGNVLVDPGVSASLSQTEETGGSESALFLQLNLSGDDGVSGGSKVWVPVAFSDRVQLQEGNPITEVEITSEEIGDLTIEVDSPGGGLGAPPPPSSSRPRAAPGAAPARSDPPGSGGQSNYRIVHFFTHQFENILQMLVVYGYVQVANPGVQPVLRPGGGTQGQGTLGLELDLWQRPGAWEQKQTWVAFNFGVTVMEQTPVTQMVISSADLGDLTVAAQSV